MLGEYAADRPDAAEAAPGLVDERYERGCGRSSLAAGKPAAAFEVPLPPTELGDFVLESFDLRGFLADWAKAHAGSSPACRCRRRDQLGISPCSPGASARQAALSSSGRRADLLAAVGFAEVPVVVSGHGSVDHARYMILTATRGSTWS